MSTSSTTPPRPPITCHVLNTVTGRPGASIPVSLVLVKPLGPSQPLHALTNSDGRVTAWESESSLEEVFRNAEQHGGDLVWSLRFDVKAYFGGEGWWEEVEVRFRTDVGEVLQSGEQRRHWHVPVLLSPWSYTTYRGS